MDHFCLQTIPGRNILMGHCPVVDVLQYSKQLLHTHHLPGERGAWVREEKSFSSYLQGDDDLDKLCMTEYFGVCWTLMALSLLIQHCRCP